MLSHIHEFKNLLSRYFVHCRLVSNSTYTQAQLRIIRGEFSATDNEIVFVVCIPGINGFPSLRASDIAKNNKQLQLFSQNDQKKILGAAYGLIRDYELIGPNVHYQLIEKFRDPNSGDELLNQEKRIIQN